MELFTHLAVNATTAALSRGRRLSERSGLRRVDAAVMPCYFFVPPHFPKPLTAIGKG
jgi:hypothetical protein